MDYVCVTDRDDSKIFILNNCERDNILYMRYIPESVNLYQSAQWCRQDREINISIEKNHNKPTREKLFNLSCVLHDNKPRKQIKMKDY